MTRGVSSNASHHYNSDVRPCSCACNFPCAAVIFLCTRVTLPFRDRLRPFSSQLWNCHDPMSGMHSLLAVLGMCYDSSCVQSQSALMSDPSSQTSPPQACQMFASDWSCALNFSSSSGTNAPRPKSLISSSKESLRLFLVASNAGFPSLDTTLKLNERASCKRNDRAKQLPHAVSAVVAKLPTGSSASWRQCRWPRSS